MKMKENSNGIKKNRERGNWKGKNKLKIKQWKKEKYEEKITAEIWIEQLK